MQYLNNNVLTGLVAVIALAYLILFPPFQAPDESNHFYRSYQISEGMFFSTKIGALEKLRGEHTGGYLPKALSQANSHFRHISFKPRRDLDKDNFTRAWEVRIDPHDRVAYTFSNTALFSFISYLAPATGIQLASYFSDRVLVQFYAARIACMLFSIFCFWLACHLFAPGRLIFFLVTVLPMNIHQLVSVSSDAYTNSLALLFTASALKLFSTEHKNGKFQVLSLFTGVLLASGKQIATPLLGILILIREKFFVSKTAHLIFIISFYLITALVIFFWAIKAQEIYNPLYWHPNTNAEAQFEHVRDNPKDTFLLFFNLAKDNALSYLEIGIGAKLGYLDTSPPQWAIQVFLFLAILLIALHPSFSKINLTQSFGFLAICFLGVFVVQLALYINTTPVGAAHNMHVHGRYFIAYFTLALVALTQLVPKSDNFCMRIYPTICIATITLTIISTIAVLWAAVERYYY